MTNITLTPELLRHYDARARKIRSNTFWSLINWRPFTTKETLARQHETPSNDREVQLSRKLAA